MKANDMSQSTPKFEIVDGANMDSRLQNPNNPTFITMQFSRTNVESGRTGDAIDRLRTLSDSLYYVSLFVSSMRNWTKGSARCFLANA